MAKTGRPRTPTALKVITGNPGKRPLNDAEPQPTATPPKCPTWLSASAKKKWKELAPELSRMGLLTIVDGDVLASYCQAWAEFEAATRTIEEEGRTVMSGGKVIGDGPDASVLGGQMQPHPAVAMQRSAWKAIKDFASLFGLDPSSRSRLTVKKGEEKPSGLKAFVASKKKV